jgi:hypothetical protein
MMPKRKPDPTCCLCGLPYERIGNNPAPLAQKGRCCDACNEIVTEARINPKRLIEELVRVEEAMNRFEPLTRKRQALAAVCASRGPGLWAAHKTELAQLRELIEAHEPDDG